MPCRATPCPALCWGHPTRATLWHTHDRHQPPAAPRDRPHPGALPVPSRTPAVTPLIPSSPRPLRPPEPCPQPAGLSRSWAARQPRGLCYWGHWCGVTPLCPGPPGCCPATRGRAGSLFASPLGDVGAEPPVPTPSPGRGSSRAPLLASPGVAPGAREPIKARAKVRFVQGSNSAGKLLSGTSQPHGSPAAPWA